MSPPRSALVSSLGALALFACGAFGGGDDDEPAKPASTVDAGSDATTSSSGSQEASTSPDASSGSCARAPVTIEGQLQGDVALTQCDGANSTGSKTFVNLGVGSALLQFFFSAGDVKRLEAALAARADAITSGQLVLHSDDKCDDCGAGLEAEAGTFTVHGARNDWKEGTTLPPRSAPDQCRRVTATDQADEKGWGADATAESSTATRIAAPIDFDAHANTATVIAGAPLVSVSIAPGDLVSRDLLTTGLLSLFLSQMPTGRLVFATHENTKVGHPALSITFCPAS